ncbi:MAG: cyclic nucleotide-binding domain-containing protein, partial [Spirochaetales bacterium]|nr:cyclic nucleotide-binding domain-containing protein [Spirochaetales bacterium]
GSILTFQGHIYLIDAGPGILDSLTALGISINEVDGIFHTHCHDDHFAGLTSLLRADHRINHYATPLVRAAIIRKFSALMSLSEESFADYFTICDLKFDEWNRIGGLDVMPVFSAHPVETSFMYFRTPWAGGYKTYGHLADIVSLDVLEAMVSSGGVSGAWRDKFRKALFIPVDVKKIDAGKGTIHGNTVDFKEDESRKIIMSHSSEEFSLKEKEIGSTTAFGLTDVLIPSRQDFSMKSAATLLRTYFPDVEMDLIRLFLDCPIQEFSPGSIILRKGTASQNVYLLLSGIAEAVDADRGISHELSQGFLIGDISFLGGRKTSMAYRAVSPVRVLEIPSILFAAFTQEFKVFEELKQLYLNRLLLLQTGLFGEMLSFPVQNRIARIMKKETYPAGTDLAKISGGDILLLVKGGADIAIDGVRLGRLEPQDFLGAEGVLFGTCPFYTAIADGEVVCCRVQGSELEGIPIIQLKMLEDFKKRIGVFSSRFTFRWDERYACGRQDTDERRRGLFRLVEDAAASLRGPGGRKKLAESWSALTRGFRDYLKYAAGLLKSASGGDFSGDLFAEAKRILDKMNFWNERVCGDTREIDSDVLEYLCAWVAAFIIGKGSG